MEEIQNIVSVQYESGCTANLQTSNNICNDTQDSNRVIFDGRFFKKIYDKCAGNKIVAMCTKCYAELKGTENSTSNFTTHLKRKHGLEYFNEYRDYMKEVKKQRKSLTKSDESTSNSYSQESFEKDIVKYFIDCMIPLRCIENIYFKNIILNIQSQSTCLNIMSRRSLGRSISLYYDEELKKIKQELDNIEFVCTTADIWSGRRRRFLGVTVHWLHPVTLKRNSRSIACRRFKGTHSYDKIYEIITNIYNQFGLDSSKIVATVTDNGSNFIKAFKIFGIQKSYLCDNDDDDDLDLITASYSSECDSDTTSSSSDTEENLSGSSALLPFHLRCASHTLSLCVTNDANKLLVDQNGDISKMHEQVMKKCNVLWRAACKPKTAEIVTSILGHSLSRPNVTRWNSLFDSMKEILSIKEKSSLLIKSLNLKTFFKDQDFTYIEEYIKCSKSIAEAIDILQGEKDTHFGILIPTLLSLRYKQENLLKEELVYCQPLAETYLESINKRFYDYFNFSSPQAEKAAIAALSHPKFLNFKWQSCISTSDYERIKKLLINELSTGIISEARYSSVSSVSNAENDFFYINSNSEEENEDKHPKRKAELIYSHFCLEQERDLNILNSYKEIKDVFLKYNTPLPSSAPVERLFSYATITNCSKTNRISDEMFEKRVVLKANLGYGEEKMPEI